MITVGFFRSQDHTVNSTQHTLSIGVYTVKDAIQLRTRVLSGQHVEVCAKLLTDISYVSCFRLADP